MILTRVRATLCCLLLLVLSGGPAGAQSRDRNAAEPGSQVERPEPPRDEPEYWEVRPVFRGLQDYRLDRGDTVREVVTIFGDATIEGHVRQDVVVVLGSLRLGSSAVVDHSVVVVGGSAYVDAGARVGRDFVVVGGTGDAPAVFSPGGNHVVVGTPVFGDALRDALPWITQGLLLGRLIVPDIEWVWIVVAVFFFIYLMINTVLDRPVAATADVIGSRPVGAFFSGLLVLLLAVPVLVIVAASVIGLAIVPFLLCGLALAAMIGKTAVARMVGRGVIRPAHPEGRGVGFLAFLVGFAALTIAYMIPLLGFATWAMTSVLGLGAATATLRSYMRGERRKTAPPPVPPAAPVTPSPLVEPVAAPAPMAPPVSPAPSPLHLDSSPARSRAADPVPPPIDPVPYTSERATPVAEAPTYQAAAPPPPPPRVEAPNYRTPYLQGLAQYPRAQFLDRLAAFVLDCVLVAITNALLNRHEDDGFFFFLLLGYHIAFWTWKGTTLGGIIINLRVIRTDGADPRAADAVIRGLSGIFSMVALGIGYLWMLQDPERQTWHDKIAGTLVVKVPRELALR